VFDGLLVAFDGSCLRAVMATEVGVHVGQRRWQPISPSVSCSIFSFVFRLASWAHRRSLRSPQGAEDPAQVRRALCRALRNNLALKALWLWLSAFALFLCLCCSRAKRGGRIFYSGRSLLRSIYARSRARVSYIFVYNKYNGKET
jgi:hypothetical protein